MGFRSSLEIYRLATGLADVVLQSDRLIEAPNWDPRGGSLLINGEGGLFRVPIDGSGGMQPIDIGFADACNNDHGFSPDGKRIFFSHRTVDGPTIYMVPSEGGAPERITRVNPSYWHGFSPDGAVISYCARREGAYEVCTMDLATREERQLTRDMGHNDGPDFSADGEWIWFNSDRTGTAEIWKMRRDGSDAQQMTSDDRVNWFPHPSPDGRHVLYLAYPEGTRQHPRDLPSELRMMDVDGSNIRTVVQVFGGQGAINVPCWSPDGSAFAFMRYRPESLNQG